MKPLQLEVIGHFSTPNINTKIELGNLEEFIHDERFQNTIEMKQKMINEIKSLDNNDMIEEVIDISDINDNKLTSDNELTDYSKENNKDENEILHTPDSYEYNYDDNNIALTEQPDSEEVEIIEQNDIYDDEISDLTESSEKVHKYKCLGFGNIFNFKWY